MKGSGEEKSRASRAGRGMPETPLSPLVSDVHRKARPHTTIPRASVIIRKYVPVARMAIGPKPAAAKAASATGHR
jgi:hypothetical protein